MNTTSNSKLKMMHQFKNFTRSHKFKFSLLGLIKFLLLGTSLLSPILFKILIDDVMIAGQHEKLIIVCLGLILIYIFESVCLSGQTYLSNKTIGKLLFDIRYTLLRNVLRMNPKKFESYKQADLKNRLDTDVESVERFYKNQIIDYLYNCIILIAMGITLLILNWKLALFGFIMIPISFLIIKRVGTISGKQWDTFRDTWSNYENSTRESFDSWTEIKLLSLEKKSSLIFTRHWHKMSTQLFKIQMLTNAYRSFISIKDFFITKMNLYFIGGLLIISGEMTIGTLLIFMKYYEQIFVSLGNIQTFDMEYKKDEPMLDRIIEVLKSEGTNKNFHGKVAKFNGHIQMKNLSVKDENDKFILRNISVDIMPNQCIALVGQSGSGKTSLLRSIAGLQNHVSGDLLFDDIKSTELDERTIFKNVGIVMQDTVVFDMTIKENLLLANPQATDEEIVEACKKAALHKEIEGLPNKYQTVLGEQGKNLSGGQRQRLAIARALMTNPKILLFDESTASLDAESEEVVLKTIKDIAMERTVIMATHRFKPLLISNRVIVIDQGKIIHDSTHEELMQSTIYHQLLVGGQALPA